MTANVRIFSFFFSNVKSGEKKTEWKWKNELFVFAASNLYVVILLSTHISISFSRIQIAFVMKCGGWRIGTMHRISLPKGKKDGKIKIPKKCRKCDKHVFHLNVHFFHLRSLSLSLKSCFDLICNICLCLFPSRFTVSKYLHMFACNSNSDFL